MKVAVYNNIEDVTGATVKFVANAPAAQGAIWTDAVEFEGGEVGDVISIAHPTTMFKKDGVLYINFPAVVAGCLQAHVELKVAGSETPVISSAILNEEGYTLKTVASEYNIPIMAFQANSVGEYGNALAYNLHTDYDRTDYDEMKRLKSFVYALNFGEYRGTNALPTQLPTKYSNSMFNILFNSGIIDPSIGSNLGFESVLPRYFGTEWPAPVTGMVYEENVKRVYEILTAMIAPVAADVGSSYKAIATELLVTLGKTPDMIDILRLTTATSDGAKVIEDNTADAINVAGYVDVAKIAGITYADNTEVDGGLTKNGYIKLKGGSNGALDNAFNRVMVNVGSTEAPSMTIDSPDGTINNSITIENKIADVWNSAADTTLIDAPRYPFNTIVDSGHLATVKLAMISVLGCRTDVKVLLSTWDGQVDYQDEANSVVAGGMYVTHIRNFKDSDIYMTGANRGVVFGQVGNIGGELYKGLLPHTLWYADKMARMHNNDFIRENPEGKTAKVEIFVKTLWTPFKDLAKKNLWGANVNYCQYFNMTQLHYASIKSVYEYESSLFVNDAFVNKVIYVKQLAPAIWANHAGRTEPNEVVYPQVIEELNTKLKHMLNGFCQFNTRMYQTAREKESGFEHHIDIELLDGMGQRIWHFDIIAKRQEA
jgi:hypothetical protein